MRAIRGEPVGLPAKAVFLHGGWRSSATWIWSLFRSHPETMGFYEPLHESLVGLTLAGIPHERPENWESRHPSIRPYFEEFAPLLSRGRRGVAGYRRSFAYERFFASDRERYPRLFAYLTNLLDLAHSRGRIPVLKFCRSQGRAEWARRDFPQALHVAIVRDPWSQWRSSWNFACEGNPFFVAAPLALLWCNRDVPIVASILDAMDLPRLPAQKSSFKSAYERSLAVVTRAAPGELYPIFLAFWMATAYVAISNADVTIESDLLVHSSAYRERIRAEVAERSGLLLDFGSARPSPLLGVDGEGRLLNTTSHRMALEGCAMLRSSSGNLAGAIAANLIGRTIASSIGAPARSQTAR